METEQIKQADTLARKWGRIPWAALLVKLDAPNLTKTMAIERAEAAGVTPDDVDKLYAAKRIEAEPWCVTHIADGFRVINFDGNRVTLYVRSGRAYQLGQVL